jgi:phosphate transport system protein
MKVERNKLLTERNQIRSNILTMGQDTVNILNQFMEALEHLDIDRSEKITNGDEHFNHLYQSIHEECLIMIARQQPVASDLREIISDLQIAIELERIADHIASAARIVHTLSLSVIPPVWEEIINMIRGCSEMMSNMLNAYQEMDVEKAEMVAGSDEYIDRMNHQIVTEIIGFMKSNKDAIENGTHLIWLVHDIERIADRVTNIGEQIVFNSSGKIADWNISKDK